MPQPSSRNLVLSRLSQADRALLDPYLKEVALPLRKVLERPGKRIKAAYFPESGFVSVVANDGKRPIEVGIIGREGMTGLPVILGGERNYHEVYVQMAGRGQCLAADDLRTALETSPTLLRTLLRYVHAYLEQTTRTAVANGRSTIEERLARWLLMAGDRIDGPDLPLTHEFLSMMLGVQRPGVTVAMQDLERRGVLGRRRGMVTILDREALERLSNGTYISADYK